MRKKQTFLLTVLTPETGATAFCGQIKVIASGKTSTFTNLDELYQLLVGEMGEEPAQLRAQLNLAFSEEQASV